MWAASHVLLCLLNQSHSVQLEAVPVCLCHVCWTALLLDKRKKKLCRAH